jgi:hypothetical protein
MDALMIVLAIIVGIALWTWIIYRVTTTKRKRDALRASAEKKDPSDWTADEREAMLLYITWMSQTGRLTYTEYEVLKAKYTGTTDSLPYGFAGGLAVDAKATADRKAQQQATRTIVKDAAIGGVVAGPAGAVVGAIVGKDKADSEKR